MITDTGVEKHRLGFVRAVAAQMLFPSYIRGVAQRAGGAFPSSDEEGWLRSRRGGLTLDQRDRAAIKVAAHFEQVEQLRGLFAVGLRFHKAAALEPPRRQNERGRRSGRGDFREQ